MVFLSRQDFCAMFQEDGGSAWCYWLALMIFSTLCFHLVFIPVQVGAGVFYAHQCAQLELFIIWALFCTCCALKLVKQRYKQPTREEKTMFSPINKLYHLCVDALQSSFLGIFMDADRLLIAYDLATFQEFLEEIETFHGYHPHHQWNIQTEIDRSFFFLQPIPSLMSIFVRIPGLSARFQAPEFILGKG